MFHDVNFSFNVMTRQNIMDIMTLGTIDYLEEIGAGRSVIAKVSPYVFAYTPKEKILT